MSIEEGAKLLGALLAIAAIFASEVVRRSKPKP